MSSEFPIIDKLGGKKAVLHQLNARGDAIQYRAMQYWFEKGVIPSVRIQSLLTIAEERGITVEISDLRPRSQAVANGS